MMTAHCAEATVIDRQDCYIVKLAGSITIKSLDGPMILCKDPFAICSQGLTLHLNNIWLNSHEPMEYYNQLRLLVCNDQLIILADNVTDSFVDNVTDNFVENAANNFVDTLMIDV